MGPMENRMLSLLVGIVVFAVVFGLISFGYRLFSHPNETRGDSVNKSPRLRR